MLTMRIGLKAMRASAAAAGKDAKRSDPATADAILLPPPNHTGHRRSAASASYHSRQAKKRCAMNQSSAGGEFRLPSLSLSLCLRVREASATSPQRSQMQHPGEGERVTSCTRKRSDAASRSSEKEAKLRPHCALDLCCSKKLPRSVSLFFSALLIE